MRRTVIMFATALVVSLSCHGILPAQTIGPLLEFSPPIVQFDTASCGRMSTASLVIRNTGDAASTVHSIDDVAVPFGGNLEGPFTLAPGERREVRLTYTPTRAPRGDSLVLDMVADNPVPAAMGFLFDLSTGMAESFGGSTRIAAARSACSAFLDRVMRSGSIGHEGAVYGYNTTSNFRLLRNFTDDVSVVKNALPSVATGAHACTWDAMQRAITLIQNRSMRKILLVFSGSKDAGRGQCGPVSAAGVINSATAANIRVYTFSFSADDESDLQNVAQQTGGRYARVSTVTELETAFDAVVTDLQYNVPQQLVLRGEAVSPALEFFPTYHVFPTTLVGDTARRRLGLHNTGTAPLHVREIDGRHAALGFDIPETIMPGDSAVIDLLFHPVRQNFFDGLLTVHYNACENGSESTRLAGMGFEAENPDIGPVLVIDPLVLDFGDVLCSASHLRGITLRNAGDEETVVPVVVLSPKRFKGEPPSERRIPPGAVDTFRVLCSPGGYVGADSGTVLILNPPGRPSRSTMAVLDMSESMGAAFDEEITRAEAAQLALGQLIADIARTPELRDSIGVVAARKEETVLLQPLTHDKAALAGIAEPPGHRDSTCVGAAITAALHELESAHNPRSVIVFTATGDPDTAICGATDFHALAQRALGMETMLHCIVMGAATADSLATLCDATGGIFRRVGNLTQLTGALGAIRAKQNVTEDIEIALRARSVSPRLTFVDSTAVRFPDTRVGDRSCREITITNTGEKPLALLRVLPALPEQFFVDETLPLSIAPNESADITCCFDPDRPGEMNAALQFETNACVYNPAIQLEAHGWDSSAVLLSGSMRARPGSLVRIPLTLSRPLDASYGVRELNVTVAYNPTLLYPDMDFPAEDPYGQPLLGTQGVILHGFDTARSLAATQYHIRRTEPGEQPIETVGADHRLGFLRLRVFLGNALSTDLMITALSEESGDYRLQGRGAMRVFIDSLPWGEERLVDPSALYGISLGKHRPNPVRGSAVIPFRLDRASQMRLALYDSGGRRVRTVREGFTSAGAYEERVDVRALPAGIYVYRIETAGGAVSRIMQITR